MEWTDIVIPAAIFAGLGLIFGAALAIASRIFAVHEDERVGKITEALPGANCGGCGFSGCAAYAEAIVKGEAAPGLCLACSAEGARTISEVMGVPVVENKPMRAQVMCSGKSGVAHKKYHYVGATDCVAAERLGGGDKCCPNGCIGLGTCAAACPYDAIAVVHGLAVVDAGKCRGCGVCVSNCPKHIIRMIPAAATHWVACLSVENGKKTREQCDAGCISCRLCEKACEHDAIKVDNFVAAIRYDKCVGCGACADKCPRHIIHFVTRS